jgi:voltage-gated potassium channel
MSAQRHPRRVDFRRRLYEVLDQGTIGPGRWVNRAIILAVLISLIVISLETVPQLASRYRAGFLSAEIIVTILFTIEYGLRLWAAAENPRYARPSAARLNFIKSPLGIVDLIALLPLWLTYVMPLDFRLLLVMRAFRVLKMARYSPAMRSLLDAVSAERRALVGCFVILLGAAFVFAAVMHLVEGAAQPDKFGTIPDAMWWAIVTLSTIGYGDVVPITAAGKVVGGIAIFAGLIMIALPVGVIANAFADVVHRRDFIITWSMVARVPLFSGLSATQIADIMKLLKAQRVEAGAIIARRGDTAHSMYFIADGEVEIEVKKETIRLGRGHFFGEIAVLHQARRSATVVALVNTSLLVLGAQDLQVLMEREPQIAERIQCVVHERLRHGAVTARGDLIAEEIEEPS